MGVVQAVNEVNVRVDQARDSELAFAVENARPLGDGSRLLGRADGLDLLTRKDDGAVRLHRAGGCIEEGRAVDYQRRLSGGPGRLPTHPVVGLAGGNWWVRLQIVIAASVTAPILEETMFRGVLYRHLREATRRWGFAASFLVSGLVNSFLFAAIHPQGLLAVPALMGLALGFTLAREWRGTLLPCMIAHGLSNGLVTLLLFAALGS